MPNSATTRSSTYLPPNNPRGTPRTGRIVTLLTGKGHGFIRLPNAREVYFHRADLQAGTPHSTTSGSATRCVSNCWRIGERSASAAHRATAVNSMT